MSAAESPAFWMRFLLRIATKMSDVIKNSNTSPTRMNVRIRTT